MNKKEIKFDENNIKENIKLNDNDLKKIRELTKYLKDVEAKIDYNIFSDEYLREIENSIRSESAYAEALNEDLKKYPKIIEESLQRTKDFIKKELDLLVDKILIYNEEHDFYTLKSEYREELKEKMKIKRSSYVGYRNYTF